MWASYLHLKWMVAEVCKASRWRNIWVLSDSFTCRKDFRTLHQTWDNQQITRGAVIRDQVAKGWKVKLRKWRWQWSWCTSSRSAFETQGFPKQKAHHMGVKHFVLEWSSKGARNSRKRDNQIRIWSYAYERQQLIWSNSYDIQQLILWSYAYEMQQFIWS